MGSYTWLSRILLYTYIKYEYVVDPAMTMLKEAFDQVKDQMGPCGIACATCDLGNGTVAETAAKLGQYLGMYSVREWAPMLPGGSDIDFDQLDKNLGWVKTYTRCFGCDRGGGPPDCAIKACAGDRGHEICSQCPDLEGCTKFDWLGDYANQLKEKLKAAEGKTKQELISEAVSDIET